MLFHENMIAISTNYLFNRTRVYPSLLLSNKCLMAYYAQLFMFTIDHGADYDSIELWISVKIPSNCPVCYVM